MGKATPLHQLRRPLCMLLVAFAMLSALSLTSYAQERPRTIIELLFGSQKAEPQPQYRQAQPQRTRPAKPKRPSKTSNSASRSPAGLSKVPEVTIIEKNLDAKKIIVVGDFISNGLAEGLDVAFATNAGVRVVSRTNGSSGFVRDDHYDWLTHIGPILEEEKPDVVIVMMGANDRQAIALSNESLTSRSPQWNTEYQRRVEEFVKQITNGKYPLIWVGQPPFRPKGMSLDMLALNEIHRSVVDKFGGTFVDIWDGFVDEDGNFSETGFDINGQTARLRGNDGINTTKAGKRKLAFYAEKPLKALLQTGAIDTSTSVEVQKPSKPSDRMGPVSLRDIYQDQTGILLGSPSRMHDLSETPRVAPRTLSPGRVDDFAWPKQNPTP